MDLDRGCKPCGGWATVVTEGVTYPCPRCQNVLYRAWADLEAPLVPELGDRLLDRVSGLVGHVVTPAEAGFEGDSFIQPCQPVDGEPCREMVLVRGEQDGVARWVRMRDVQKVSAPAGRLAR